VNETRPKFTYLKHINCWFLQCSVRT